jgi:anti-sigma factor RsiW
VSCSNYEQRIALYVEEDLAPSDSAQVAAHLQECSDCWDLAEDLRESQARFKSIRVDIPNETALSALRERVLGEVAALEPRTWFERLMWGGLRRNAALAGVALVLAGSGAIWLARSPGIQPERPAVVAANPTPSVLESPAEPPAVRPLRKRFRRAAPEPIPAPAAEEPKQTAIKLLTDDPSVIIYWLVDEKGD